MPNLIRIRILFYIILYLFVLKAGNGQNVSLTINNIEWPSLPENFAVIPDEVDETSGVILFDGDILTFNDSGGKAELYKIKPDSGGIVQVIKLTNATNVDWEDITQDADHIYVGDFGNNRGDRTNLRIYKINKSDITDKSVAKVKAEAIGFSYADQTAFDPKNRANNFDCESVLNYGDSLIIFSKDWDDNRCRMYKLPKTPGKYVINPNSSFDAKGLITGADYNPETGKLVLIGYQNFIPFIYQFDHFDGITFKSDRVYRINLRKMFNSQTEGICWFDNTNVVITTEQRDEWKQAAYKLDVEYIIKEAAKAFE